MENLLVMETRYREHQARVARLNGKNWQFERPVKRYSVRQAIAEVLVTLANALSPTTQREMRTA